MTFIERGISMPLVRHVVALMLVGASAWGGDGPKVFMFTKSQGFQHDVVARKKPDELSMAEKIVTELGKENGFEVTCSKDGTLINPEHLAGYQVLYFFTQGELDAPAEKTRDKAPAVDQEKRACVLDFIKNGGGFVGTHCGGADTWHNWREGNTRPFLDVVGAEFRTHGAQQKSTVRVVDSSFPAVQGWPAQFELNDEWYAYKGFMPNIRVLMMLETEGMSGPMYKRDDYPITWCSTFGEGRVFYTGLGHRDDVWTNPLYQKMVAQGILWAAKKVEGKSSPNLAEIYGDIDNAMKRLNRPFEE
jgi:type 1 glutamine amidotransferase